MPDGSNLSFHYKSTMKGALCLYALVIVDLALHKTQRERYRSLVFFYSIDTRECVSWVIVACVFYVKWWKVLISPFDHLFIY